MIVVDAKNQILGRLATNVAKLALRGEVIRVINCEHVIITGKKEEVLGKYVQRRKRGIPLKGPYYPKQSDRIVRRAIRGMLPYKKARGAQAYKNVLCYVNIPHEFQDRKTITFDDAKIEQSNAPSFVKLGDIAKLIGGSR